MGFETINALGHPTMLEGLVKLRAGFLHLHSGLQAVRRDGPSADNAVNSFLDVDKRWFHGFITIGRLLGQSKPNPPVQAAGPGAWNAKAKNAAMPRKTNATK